MPSLVNEASNLAHALHFLHTQIYVPVPGYRSEFLACCHMDLKPDNILVFRSPGNPVGIWKITDFGISTLKQTTPSGGKGKDNLGVPTTVGMIKDLTTKTFPQRNKGTFQAPEVNESIEPIGSKGVGRKSDVWSFGCILVLIFAFGLGGLQELKDFDKGRRQKDPDSGLIADYFYSQSQGSAEWMISPHVEEFLRKLPRYGSQGSRGSFSINYRECRELLFKVLVANNPDQRPEAIQIYEGLREVLSQYSKSKVDDRDRFSQIEDSDSEIGVSHSSSVFSLETAGTSSTKPTTEGYTEDEPGIQGIVNFLTSDEGLIPLYARVSNTNNIDGARFQRNFRRLLRQFAIDLGEEQYEGLEKVPPFIRSCKGTIAGRVWAAIDNGGEEIVESVSQQPLDNSLKDERLAIFISQRLPASSLFPEDEHDQDRLQTTTAQSERDSQTDSETGLNKAMRYSQQLDTILRQSQALSRLRVNFSSWLNPKPLKVITKDFSTKEELVEHLSSADGQEKLTKLVAGMAFIPPEHIVSVTISGRRCQTPSDRLKLYFEDYTKLPWVWWPLKPPERSLQEDEVVLEWKCVSILFL